jgi:hypothetical protein
VPTPGEISVLVSGFLFLSFALFALRLRVRECAFPVPVPYSLFPSQHSTFLNPWFMDVTMSLTLVHDTIDRHCEFHSLLTGFLFLF